MNQGFLTLEQPDTYHIILSMVLFLGQKKLFPEIFLLLCTLSPQTKQSIKKILQDQKFSTFIIAMKLSNIMNEMVPGGLE